MSGGSTQLARFTGSFGISIGRWTDVIFYLLCVHRQFHQVCLECQKNHLPIVHICKPSCCVMKHVFYCHRLSLLNHYSSFVASIHPQSEMPLKDAVSSNEIPA
jgi:hypothetical protein